MWRDHLAHSGEEAFHRKDLLQALVGGIAEGLVLDPVYAIVEVGQQREEAVGECVDDAVSGVIVVQPGSASAEEWLSVQLVMAVTIGLLGWDARATLGGVLAFMLLASAVAFAMRATANYRVQRRVR